VVEAAQRLYGRLAKGIIAAGFAALGKILANFIYQWLIFYLF